MPCILDCLGQLFLEAYSQNPIILQLEKQKSRIQINKNNCTYFQAFNAVFHKAAIKQAEKSGDIQCHISNLTAAVTYSTFIFTSQGLFEKDKLIFLAQIAFQVRKKFQIGDAGIYWICCFFTRRWCLCPDKLSCYPVAVQILTQCDCCFSINHNCRISKDTFM